MTGPAEPPANQPADDEEDLTDWERLQVAATYQILKHKNLATGDDDITVLIEHPDRLNQHGPPPG